MTKVEVRITKVGTLSCTVAVGDEQFENVYVPYPHLKAGQRFEAMMTRLDTTMHNRTRVRFDSWKRVRE